MFAGPGAAPEEWAAAHSSLCFLRSQGKNHIWLTLVHRHRLCFLPHSWHCFWFYLSTQPVLALLLLGHLAAGSLADSLAGLWPLARLAWGVGQSPKHLAVPP